MFKTIYVTDKLLFINIFSFHDGESINYYFWVMTPSKKIGLTHLPES